MKTINKSCDSFRKLRETNSYYVDKTMLLEEYLSTPSDEAVLFSRPRRFGKTLTMTMFKEFLDVRRNSREIFEGLKIMDHKKIVEDYMNKYPVVFLSLKEVSGDSFDDLYRNLQIVISEICEDFKDLLDRDEISETTKEFFHALWKQKAEKANTEQALALFRRMMRQVYKKPAFVIIDEYDVPMAKALGTPHYEQVRDMIERMLSFVCKTNDNVKAVILSGCLYTVKNSSYTGVNNIISYSVLSPKYADCFGFTEEDVARILEDADLTHLADTVREWYDGYLFGRTKMYCPWDVLRFVASVLDGTFDDERGPESYWVNTSDTSLALIHGFLGKTQDATEKFEQLLTGNAIDCIINENIAYHNIHKSGDNLWSALVETGYLTKTVKGRPLSLPLVIPNNSIRVAFRNEVWNFFRDKVDNVYVGNLVSALWAGETKKAQETMNLVLESTLSFYHEYHEYSYHLILDGFFTGRGYIVLSEAETGYGRSNLVVLDRPRDRCMILELKHASDGQSLEAALREATGQTVKKKYESRLKYEGYTHRLQYGMAFKDKQALISGIPAKPRSTKTSKKSRSGS